MHESTPSGSGVEKMDLGRKRILVTGGGGFLGMHVLARLHGSGCRQVFAPRRSEFNLVKLADIRKLVTGFRPEIVIHLAAMVGGIGVHARKPGAIFYENIMMGCQLMEVCREVGVEKFLSAGTICSYPKYTPLPFREDDLWNGYPAE